MGPGWTEFARIPSRAYWSAVVFVSSRTAPLDAVYCGLLSSMPTSPSWDEMFTIEPPPPQPGRDVHDRAPTGPAHGGDDGLGSQEHAGRVDTHHALPRVERRVFD